MPAGMTGRRWVLGLLALAFVMGGLALSSGRGEAQGRGGPPGATPLHQDTDGDGVPDYLDSDDDNDGMTDAYEEQVTETDPRLRDSDGDGVTDAEEVIGEVDQTGERRTTDPNDDDSDDDGWTDGFERGAGTDPNDDHSRPDGVPGEPPPPFDDGR